MLLKAALLLGSALLSYSAGATISAVPKNEFIIEAPKGVSKLLIASAPKKVDRAAYDFATGLVQLMFPRLKDFDERTSRILADKANEEKILAGASKTIQGRCLVKAGMVEYTRKEMGLIYNSTTLTYLVASHLALNYSLEELKLYKEFFGNPSFQRVVQAMANKGMEPTNHISVFVAYLRLYNEGLISAEDIKAIDALSKRPEVEKLNTFDEDTHTAYTKLIKQLKVSEWSEAIIQKFCAENKKTLDECVKESAA